MSKPVQAGVRACGFERFLSEERSFRLSGKTKGVGILRETHVDHFLVGNISECGTHPTKAKEREGLGLVSETS